MSYVVCQEYFLAREIESSANISYSQAIIPRNRVSREDDNAISTFPPKKPGFLTDVRRDRIRDASVETPLVLV